MIYLYVYICNGFRQTILNNPHVFDRSSPTCRGKCRSPDSRSKAPPQPWNRPGKRSVMKKLLVRSLRRKIKGAILGLQNWLFMLKY